MKNFSVSIKNGILVGLLLIPLFSLVIPATAATEDCYANSYSNNNGWYQVTEAYSDNGNGAKCEWSLGQIDYGITDPTLNLTSWLFYTCKVRIEWRCLDTGGGGPFSLIPKNQNLKEDMEISEDTISPLAESEGKIGGVTTLGDGILDKLYVQLYHKTTNSWTSWRYFRHLNQNWDDDVITESTKYWSPDDLKFLKVRLRHQASTDPDRIEVDYVRLEVDDTASWAYYLSSDWTRHPDDQDVNTTAHNIANSDPNNKTGAIYENFTTDWWWNNAPGSYIQDTVVLENHSQSGWYYGKCYSSVALYTSLCRALDIPARIIRFKLEGWDDQTYARDHVGIEFYINGVWIPASNCGECYLWYGWDDHTNEALQNYFPEWHYIHEDKNKCIDIFVILEVLGNETAQNGIPINVVMSQSLRDFDSITFDKYCNALGYTPPGG